MKPDHPADPPLQTIATALGPVQVTDTGTGPAVVALHGAPGSHRDFRWLEPALPGLRTVRVDLPGFGATPWSTLPDRAPAGRARILEPLLDALGIDRCVVVGHSIGGPVAIAAALASDRVTGVALVASPGLRPHKTYRYVRPGLWSRLLDVPGVATLTRPMMRWGFNVAGFPRSTPDAELVSTCLTFGALDFAAMRKRVHALRTPTLLAWADDDPLIERSVFEELAHAAPEGPRLRFATGGHNLQKTRAVEIGEALQLFAGR